MSTFQKDLFHYFCFILHIQQAYITWSLCSESGGLTEQVYNVDTGVFLGEVLEMWTLDTVDSGQSCLSFGIGVRYYRPKTYQQIKMI